MIDFVIIIMIINTMIMIIDIITLLVIFNIIYNIIDYYRVNYYHMIIIKSIMIITHIFIDNNDENRNI